MVPDLALDPERHLKVPQGTTDVLSAARFVPVMTLSNLPIVIGVLVGPGH